MKKVSVIIPNYNHAPFLRERLDSVLAQDYPDFEVILLDDASTDNSVAILSKYTSHPKVKTLLVNDRNSGNTFLQWQRGLALAEGEYFWIAESDDVAEPALLSRLVSALEHEQATLAFCHSLWIDSEGCAIHHSRDPRFHRDFSMNGAAFARQYLLGYTTICNASAVVFRRDAAAAVDMQQVAQFTASGDRLFWVEIVRQGRIAYLADTLNRFRQHTHKVSGTAENRGINIRQDHEIYRLCLDSLKPSLWQRRMACGYHWQACHRPSVSFDGRQEAMAVWAAEKEFSVFSFWLYMVHRLREKLWN